MYLKKVHPLYLKKTTTLNSTEMISLKKNSLICGTWGPGLRYRSNFRLKVKIPVSHKITVYLSMTIEIVD